MLKIFLTLLASLSATFYPYDQLKAASHDIDYNKIKAGLDGCFQDLKDSRNLQEAVLAGLVAGQCESSLRGMPLNLKNFDPEKMAQAINFSSIKEEVKKKSLINAATVGMIYRTEFEESAKLSNDYSKKVFFNNLCKGCGPEEKSLFENAKNQFRPSPGENFKAEKLISEFNVGIEELNTSLKAMEEAKNLSHDKGHFEKAYEDYLSKYQKLTASPEGALLLTDHFRSFMGKLVLPSDAHNLFIVAGKTQFPKHKLLSQNNAKTNIRLALQEIENKVGHFSKKIRDAHSFDDLLRIDPSMVGGILAANPRLMEEVCSASQRVMAADAIKKSAFERANNVLDYIDYATLGLLATGGVGYLARKGVLGGARGILGQLALSPSGMALEAQAMKSAMTIGAVSEVGHMTVDGAKLAEISNMSQEILRGRMALAKNDSDIKRLSQVEEKWNETLSNLILSTGVNGVAFASGIMKARTGALAKSAQKKNHDLAFDENNIKWIDDLDKKDVERMGEIMASKSNDEKENIMAALSVAADINPKKLKDLLKSDLEKTLNDLGQIKGANSCSL